MEQQHHYSRRIRWDACGRPRTRLPRITNKQIPEVTPEAWAKNATHSATASRVINVVASPYDLYDSLIVALSRGARRDAYRRLGNTQSRSHPIRVIQNRAPIGLNEDPQLEDPRAYLAGRLATPPQAANPNFDLSSPHSTRRQAPSHP